MSYLRPGPIDEHEYPPFASVKRQFGFVPNFYRAQTLRPDLIEAEMGLLQSVLIHEGALTRQQKEYVFLVCSAANLSTYCVTAHCEIVRMLGLQGPEPERIAVDHLHTDIPVADKALLNFALKLTRNPTRVGRDDIEGLRTYGFGDEQILETIILVGFAKFANFVSFGLGVAPDFDTTRVRLPKD
jgi:uncharacterized peroxidase-related enzyme